MKSLEEINEEIAETESLIATMNERVQAAQTEFEEDVFFGQMLQLLKKRNALRWVTE